MWPSSVAAMFLVTVDRLRREPYEEPPVAIIKALVRLVLTFEEEPVSTADMARRIEEVQAAAFPWLVAEQGGELLGYAYGARWKARSGYRFSAEVTVYLVPEATGRGLGSRLYSDLFQILRAKGIHIVIGGIALPNEASVALHEKMGLEKVAHFREVGFKMGRWIDVGYWQRAL